MAAGKRRRKKAQDPGFLAQVERFREAIRDAGLDPDRHGDQTKVAKETGVQQQVINRFLRGERQPGYVLMQKLAIGLRVTPGWLAWGDAPKPLATGIEAGSGATPEDLIELGLRRLREQKR